MFHGVYCKLIHFACPRSVNYLPAYVFKYYIVIADWLMHCLLSSSKAKITLVVPEIIFQVAVITSPVVKIIFCSG